MSFKDSSGERWTKTEIDHKIREAKKEFLRQLEYDERLFCATCGCTSCRLTCSHIVSVNDCQNDSKCEQAWNVENLELLCTECHHLWEWKKELNEKRFDYLEYYGEL